MGHSKAAKEKSHQRIVKTAAARFRERGVDGIGVAELMKEADLTHGGFYGHFDSRAPRCWGCLWMPTSASRTATAWRRAARSRAWRTTSRAAMRARAPRTRNR